MKKFLLFAIAGILLCCADAKEQKKPKLTLEQEAEKFHKFSEDADKIAPDTKKRRNKARLEAYQKALTKSVGNQMIQAYNPPECKYYSTEGVCTLLNTVISPYPAIAHVNTLLDFKFPKHLGGFTAYYIQVYSPQKLGYSIKYIAPAANCKADVYIYDMPLVPLKNEEVLIQELQSAAQAIGQMYQDVKFDGGISRANFLYGNKERFFYFVATYRPRESHPQTTGEKYYSGTVIFSKNQKLIKLRITQTKGNQLSFRKCFNGFVGAIDKDVVFDSQNRKKKFKKAETLPIILP